MINDVIDAIAIALYAEFGGGYKIYTDNVEQGLDRPCFFIIDLTTTVNPYLGSRRNNVCSFDVHYFSDTETNKDLNDTAAQLLDCLKLVVSTQGNKYLGTKLHVEKEDGVLHCFVNYNFTTRDKENLDNAMADVLITPGLEDTNGDNS